MILSDWNEFFRAFTQKELTMSKCTAMCRELIDYITMLSDSVRSKDYSDRLYKLMVISHEDFIGTIGTGNEEEKVTYPYYWVIENFLVSPLARKGVVIPKEDIEGMRGIFRSLPDKLSYINNFYTIMYGEQSINATLLNTFEGRANIAQECMSEIKKIPCTEKQYKSKVIKKWLEYRPTKNKYFSTQEIAKMFTDVTEATFVYQNVSANTYYKEYFE